MKPKVSIIVPVYGVEKYIRQCLNSLLAQRYTPLEIIVIDDGSPDKCPEICDEYAQKNSNIILLHQANRGVGYSRNRGISIASGDYICFVDPDDWIEPNMISAMANAAIEQNADIVICDWQTCDVAGNNCVLHTQNIDNNWGAEKIRDEFLLDHYPNFLCNKLFHKSIWRGLSIPMDTDLEDLYICAELFIRSRKNYYVPHGLYYYRVHASFASTREKVRRKHGMFAAWHEHERVCEKYHLLPLKYSRQRALKAAISLLTINEASPYLTQKQKEDVQEYLRESEKCKVALPLKHKLQWYCLKHLPFLCKTFGEISIWFDSLKH